MNNEDTTGTTPAALSYRTRVPLLLMILAVRSSLTRILIDATPFDTESGYALFVIPSLIIVWAVIGVYSRRLAALMEAKPFARFLMVASILVAFVSSLSTLTKKGH